MSGISVKREVDRIHVGGMFWFNRNRFVGS